MEARVLRAFDGVRTPAEIAELLAAQGTRLGAYEIVAPLGAGGMGEVYVARDPSLGRKVAIKLLPVRLSGDKETLARFTRECYGEI